MGARRPPPAERPVHRLQALRKQRWSSGRLQTRATPSQTHEETSARAETFRDISTPVFDSRELNSQHKTKGNGAGAMAPSIRAPWPQTNVAKQQTIICKMQSLACFWGISASLMPSHNAVLGMEETVVFFQRWGVWAIVRVVYRGERSAAAQASKAFSGASLGGRWAEGARVHARTVSCVFWGEGYSFYDPHRPFLSVVTRQYCGCQSAFQEWPGNRVCNVLASSMRDLPCPRTFELDSDVASERASVGCVSSAPAPAPTDPDGPRITRIGPN
eukprot:10747873-Lingulodinium_polyedra.AAC.2